MLNLTVLLDFGGGILTVVLDYFRLYFYTILSGGINKMF